MLDPNTIARESSRVKDGYRGYKLLNHMTLLCRELVQSKYNITDEIWSTGYTPLSNKWIRRGYIQQYNIYQAIFISTSKARIEKAIQHKKADTSNVILLSDTDVIDKQSLTLFQGRDFLIGTKNAVMEVTLKNVLKACKVYTTFYTKTVTMTGITFLELTEGRDDDLIIGSFTSICTTKDVIISHIHRVLAFVTNVIPYEKRLLLRINYKYNNYFGFDPDADIELKQIYETMEYYGTYLPCHRERESVICCRQQLNTQAKL